MQGLLVLSSVAVIQDTLFALAAFVERNEVCVERLSAFM